MIRLLEFYSKPHHSIPLLGKLQIGWYFWCVMAAQGADLVVMISGTDAAGASKTVQAKHEKSKRIFLRIQFFLRWPTWRTRFKDEQEMEWFLVENYSCIGANEIIVLGRGIAEWCFKCTVLCICKKQMFKKVLPDWPLHGYCTAISWMVNHGVSVQCSGLRVYVWTKFSSTKNIIKIRSMNKTH